MATVLSPHAVGWGQIYKLNKFKVVISLAGRAVVGREDNSWGIMDWVTWGCGSTGIHTLGLKWMLKMLGMLLLLIVYLQTIHCYLNVTICNTATRV